MIRKFKIEDLSQVMELWLNINVHTHNFISKNYWLGNFDLVKRKIAKAEIFVFESEDKIKAFVGIFNGFIAGLFVCEEMQSKGIGKQLLKKAKSLYPQLSLAVYQKNNRAVKFYQREHFIIKKEQIDENTGETEYIMTWNR